MNDIEKIRAALFSFATAPESFFEENFAKFKDASVALTRIEKILEAKDERLV